MDYFGKLPYVGVSGSKNLWQLGSLPEILHPVNPKKGSPAGTLEISGATKKLFGST